MPSFHLRYVCPTLERPGSISSSREKPAFLFIIMQILKPLSISILLIFDKNLMSYTGCDFAIDFTHVWVFRCFCGGTPGLYV